MRILLLGALFLLSSPGLMTAISQNVSCAFEPSINRIQRLSVAEYLVTQIRADRQDFRLDAKVLVMDMGQSIPLEFGRLRLQDLGLDAYPHDWLHPGV